MDTASSQIRGCDCLWLQIQFRLSLSCPQQSCLNQVQFQRNERYSLSLVHSLVFDDESSIWHLLFETSLIRTLMNATMDFEIWHVQTHFPFVLAFFLSPWKQFTELWTVCRWWCLLRRTEWVLHSGTRWTRLFCHRKRKDYGWNKKNEASFGHLGLKFRA